MPMEDKDGKTNETSLVWPGMQTNTTSFGEVRDACKFLGNLKAPIIGWNASARRCVDFDKKGGLLLSGYRYGATPFTDHLGNPNDGYFDLFNITDYIGPLRDTYVLNGRYYLWYFKIGGWHGVDYPNGSGNRHINAIDIGSGPTLQVPEAYNLSPGPLSTTVVVDLGGGSVMYFQTQLKPATSDIMQVRYVNDTGDSDHDRCYFFYRVIAFPRHAAHTPT